MKLRELNRLPAAEAERAMLDCCGSRRWARTLTAARPFADLDTLRARAEHEWWKLPPSDWLEAFGAHPRIGERKDGGGDRDGARAAGWSAGEQAGMAAADAALRDELAAANRAYDERFGYLYVVCASGKTGRWMLADLRARLDNSADEEIRVAAGEQAAITRLRLEKLLAEEMES
jgi:OHCU decarboxylase